MIYLRQDFKSVFRLDVLFRKGERREKRERSLGGGRQNKHFRITVKPHKRLYIFN